MEGLIRSLAKRLSAANKDRFEDLCQEGRQAVHVLDSRTDLVFVSKAEKDRFYINTIFRRMLDYLRKDHLVNKKLKRQLLEDMSQKGIVEKELEFWDSIDHLCKGDESKKLAIVMSMEGHTILKITETTGLQHREVSNLLYRALKVTRD